MSLFVGFNLLRDQGNAQASVAPAIETSAKGGVIQLTRSMAADFGPQGIRVNCLCPGRIETPLVHELWLSNGMSIEEGRQRDSTSDVRPLRRIGLPDDVAYGALYLASSESRFVTGISLIIDGGARAVGR